MCSLFIDKLYLTILCLHIEHLRFLGPVKISISVLAINLQHNISHNVPHLKSSFRYRKVIHQVRLLDLKELVLYKKLVTEEFNILENVKDIRTSDGISYIFFTITFLLTQVVYFLHIYLQETWEIICFFSEEWLKKITTRNFITRRDAKIYYI